MIDQNQMFHSNIFLNFFSKDRIKLSAKSHQNDLPYSKLMDKYLIFPILI